MLNTDILFFSDDILKARAKEREAQEFSDIVTEEDESNRSKRRKKVSRRVVVSSESSSGVDENVGCSSATYPSVPSQLLLIQQDEPVPLSSNHSKIPNTRDDGMFSFLLSHNIANL